MTFQGAWKVSLSSVTKGLFDQLADIQLSELNLDRYNHPWNIETIGTFAEATDGIVYPAIDYGSLTNGIFPQDTLCPGMFAKTIVNTMLWQLGYRAVGGWTGDPLYNRIVIPFTEEEPQSHDSDWQLARMARVTVTGTFPTPPFSTL